LQEAIERTRNVLRIPGEYRIGIVAGSDTGAVEMALWSLLGPKPVDVLAWESFGEDWVTDIVKQLNLQFVLSYTAEEFADSLLHLAEGRVDAKALITGTVGLDGVAGAFADLANPERHAKVMIDPWR
jgi:phosphoserine aminotransferase